jgi:hypothetical protein
MGLTRRFTGKAENKPEEFGAMEVALNLSDEELDQLVEKGTAETYALRNKYDKISPG